MTAPQRPFRKRRRWIAAAAAAVLWLVVAYPLGFGVISYADGRHWVPPEWYGPLRTAYLPFFTSRGTVRREMEPVFAYLYELGDRHREAARSESI